MARQRDLETCHGKGVTADEAQNDNDGDGYGFYSELYESVNIYSFFQRLTPALKPETK